jgi:hypothetical protein
MLMYGLHMRFSRIAVSLVDGDTDRVPVVLSRPLFAAMVIIATAGWIWFLGLVVFRLFGRRWVCKWPEMTRKSRIALAATEEADICEFWSLSC